MTVTTLRPPTGSSAQRHRTAHAWMPHSPCGAGCVPSDSPVVRSWRVVLRCLAIVVVLAIVPLLLAARCLPASARRAAAGVGARGLLGSLGIGLRVRGDRSPATGTLIVANHVSWTDVLVLAAVFPCRFVARADLVEWPVLGLLARIVRVIPVARERLRSLPGTVEEVADTLRAGGTVVVFPEGTTWCGTAYGRFRPALLQAAIDVGADVRPVQITYRDRGGCATAATAFVGDEGIGASMSRILRLSGVRAEVRVSEAIPAVGDRRDLARRAEAAVRGTPADRIPPMTLVTDRRPVAG